MVGTKVDVKTPIPNAVKIWNSLPIWILKIISGSPPITVKTEKQKIKTEQTIITFEKVESILNRSLKLYWRIFHRKNTSTIKTSTLQLIPNIEIQLRIRTQLILLGFLWFGNVSFSSTLLWWKFNALTALLHSKCVHFAYVLNTSQLVYTRLEWVRWIAKRG